MQKTTAVQGTRAMIANLHIAAILTLALSACGSATPPPPVEKTSTATSVEEVQAMFAENQIGGAQYFESRMAIFTGEVVRVREALGAGILVFKSAKSGAEVELAFDEEGTQKLGGLRAGNQVQVTCPVIKEVFGEVFFGCSTVRVIQPIASSDP